MASTSRSKKPAGVLPVANANGGPEILAPWPLVDRYPTTISGISVAYIRSIFTLCLTGYRQQYVDLLNQLLIMEPHGYAVLQHRFNSTSGGRVEITPRRLPMRGEKEHPEADEARLIADDIAAVIDAIPERQPAFNRLLWGLYYGVSGAEILYEYGGYTDWSVVGLNFIHSRRISYPDQASWRPRIWDQGSISPLTPIGANPTTQMFGACVDDFPGKFIIFEASIRGDYPTREGLGQQLAYWMALKGIGVRGMGEYIERYGKPWALGTFNTVEPGDPPRAATKEDIQKLDAALMALGIGALSAAALPDSVKVQLMGPGVSAGSNGITHKELIAIADAQIEEVVLTTSGITTPGPNGSRSSREVMKEGTRETFRYDARCLADCLKRDLIRPLVALRHPGKEHLCPDIAIHADEKPNPKETLKVAKLAVEMGMPVAAEPLAKQVGLELVPAKEGEEMPRRLYPAKPVEPYDLPIPACDHEAEAEAEGEKDPNAPDDEDEPDDSEDDAAEEEDSEEKGTAPKDKQVPKKGAKAPPKKAPAKGDKGSAKKGAAKPPEKK